MEVPQIIKNRTVKLTTYTTSENKPQAYNSIPVEPRLFQHCLQYQVMENGFQKTDGWIKKL
jgi:hypothetical protein